MTSRFAYLRPVLAQAERLLEQAVVELDSLGCGCPDAPEAKRLINDEIDRVRQLREKIGAA